MERQIDINCTNVLMNVLAEMANTEDKNSINKIYRQARTWAHFQCYYANAITEDEKRYLNKKFKRNRIKRLVELGYFEPVDMEEFNEKYKND